MGYGAKELMCNIGGAMYLLYMESTGCILVVGGRRGPYEGRYEPSFSSCTRYNFKQVNLSIYQELETHSNKFHHNLHNNLCKIREDDTTPNV